MNFILLSKRSYSVATELGPVFAYLFQQSFDTGEIPKEWSLANICPLFKKSDRSLVGNYRPVSLTCVPCKLLEHIVCSNIIAHLDEYKLLSDRQHAFKKGHSCETQLTTVINWSKILDNRGQVDTFILDFEKAFDTPPHELLKSKLFSYGIGDKTLKWIKSFLCFRQQRVVVNGVKPDWVPVLSDVPQGTVLGPLLFSLYINDISSDIESEIRLFADDCVCYREIKGSVRMAERLALPTSDHGVAGSNPAGGEILPEPKRRFIAQSLSCSPLHRLEMTEILLKGRKTLTHPSIMKLRMK